LKKKRNKLIGLFKDNIKEGFLKLKPILSYTSKTTSVIDILRTEPDISLVLSLSQLPYEEMQVVAEQLCLLFSSQVSILKAQDFSVKGSTNLQLFARLSDHFERWISTEIFKTIDQGTRDHTLAKILHLGDKLLDLNNFQGAYSVHVALELKLGNLNFIKVYYYFFKM